MLCALFIRGGVVENFYCHVIPSLNMKKYMYNDLAKFEIPHFFPHAALVDALPMIMHNLLRMNPVGIL